MEIFFQEYKLLIILGITVILILSGLCCYLSIDLQNEKGYSANIFLGFILGFIYLVYSVGLPARQYTTCSQCGNLIYSDNTECPHCGKKVYKE